MAAPLRRLQVNVKISGHQQRRPAGALANVRYSTLNGCNVVRDNIAANNKLAPTAIIQLDARHVCPMQMYVLNFEIGRVPEEYVQSPAMPAWRV